ncbi:MAG: hypothetical protein ACOYLQ_06295 [Hyphomicrobiaceae bacterium]
MRTPTTLIVLALLAGGCAQALPGGTPTARKVVPDTSGAYEGGAYKLSADELTLDCKKLAGRMQVRILQIRDADTRKPTTGLSQGLQSAVTPVFGGATYGASSQGDLARDRAMLDAYNAQLKAKGCGTFDLDAELASRDVTHTPRPQPKR